jgi:hypothetical protein
MKNHLFIGLGGQGGNTIAALRKVIESRENDVKTLKDRGQQWDYLYIDSSRDVSNVRKNWSHFGKDLSLQPDSFLYLKEDGSSIDADSLALKPDVAPWIGDTSILREFLSGTQGIVGSNQRRRLGRLLFARNAEMIRAACQKKISHMLKLSNRCAIHIFASIAGGTGSGCLIDLITSLRTAYANASTDDGFPIFVYLYTTEQRFPESQVGYFHENQAAVLRDLNALACGKYHPHLLGTAIGGERFASQQPVTQIVLSSQLSSQNQMLSLEQQHQIVAEATFERIFCYSTGNLSTEDQKGITGEDKTASYPGEPTNNPLRTFRFGSFGMRRWEVPINEIRELLAADLAHTCLNHILYQNWNDRTGPSGEKLQSGIPGYGSLVSAIQNTIDIEKVETSHLKPLIESLNEDIKRYHEGKRREKFSNADLEDYERGIIDRFQNHLSDQGVELVFQRLQSARNERLTRIEESIHENLRAALNRSKDPVGLAYFHDVLVDLQQRFRESIGNIKTSSTDDQPVRDRMRLRTREWRKMTPLSRPFRQEHLAVAHRENTLDLLRQELRRRAAKEDNELLDSVVKLLGILAADYRRACDTLAEKSLCFAKRRDQFLRDLQDLKAFEQGGNSTKLANRAELSPKELEEHLTVQRLERNLLQNTCDALIEKSLYETLGNDRLTKIGRFSEAQNQQFEDVTETIIFEQVKQIHDVVCERNHSNPVLTGHVLDILQRRHLGDPERFKADLKTFIDSSASSLRLRAGSEIQPSVIRQDAGMPSMPREAMVIGLPSGHPFSRILQEMISPLMSAGSITVSSVYFHDDPTQIRMLSMTYWMAARFAQVVHELDSMYIKSLQRDQAGDKKYFTNLDDSGEIGVRPPLLLPTPEQARRSARAALWLGTELIAPGTNEFLIQETSDGVKLVETTQNGIQLRRLGDSFQTLRRSPDIVTASLLNDAVTNALESLEVKTLDALRSRVQSEDSALRAAKGVTSPEYDEWIGDRNQILELLER